MILWASGRFLSKEYQPIARPLPALGKITKVTQIDADKHPSFPVLNFLVCRVCSKRILAPMYTKMPQCTNSQYLKLGIAKNSISRTARRTERLHITHCMAYTVVTVQESSAAIINRLTPNDPYMGRTAPLTSKRCILYIYSTNIGTECFKHALYSPFSLFKMQFVS